MSDVERSMVESVSEQIKFFTQSDEFKFQAGFHVYLNMDCGLFRCSLCCCSSTTSRVFPRPICHFKVLSRHGTDQLERHTSEL